MLSLSRTGFTMMVALITAVMLSACFGGDDGNDRPAVTPPDASAATELTQLADQTPSTQAPSVPPSGVVDGETLVYSKEVRSVTEGRYWPTRAIVAFDPGSGERETLLEYGGVNDFPVREALTEDSIYYATENRVVVVEPDGSAPRELFSTAGQFAIEDFDVSPDGSTLAVAMREAGTFPFRSQLVFVNVLSGEDTRVENTDPAFEGFAGYFSTIRWQADGETLSVIGATASSIPGGVATVSLDGSVAVQVLPGNALLSPDGKHAAGGAPAPCNQGPSTMTSELVVTDLASGEAVTLAEPETGYFAYAWSPDGSELLFRSQPFDDTGACIPAGPWQLLGEDGETSEVIDLDAVFTAWYGDELVLLVCDTADDRPEAIVFNRSLQHRKACGSGPEPQGELRVDGVTVERLFEVRVLGLR